MNKIIINISIILNKIIYIYNESNYDNLFVSIPCGILSGYFLFSAFFRIIESDPVPSHPAKTYVNFKFGVHAASTFIVGISFLPRCLGASLEETLILKCVPSNPANEKYFLDLFVILCSLF
jgi:hypothetical protein